MQNTIVMAFRARLRSCGYTGVSIYRMKKMFKSQQIYKVIAYDPLCSNKCVRYMDLYDMDRWR